MNRHSFTTPLALASVLALISCAGWTSHLAAQAPAAAAPTEPEKYNDPAVQALMETNPEKPQDLLNVISLLLDLNQPKPAKTLFKKLLALEIDDAELVALGKKVGSAGLYRIARTPEFKPDAVPFVDKVSAAMNRAARDPAKIEELIERLKQPSLDARLQAVDELRQGRELAAQALLSVLYDPARAEEHASVRTALAAIGGDGIEPLGLIAVFAADAERIEALKVLGAVEASEAAGPLYAGAFGSKSSSIVRQVASQGIVRRSGTLPTPISAAAELYLDAKRMYLARPREIELTQVDRQWTWDSTLKRPTLALGADKRLVQLARAALLADIAADISGRDPNAVTLAQAASLEAAMQGKPTAKPGAAAGEAPAAPADAAPTNDPAAPAAPAEPDAAAATPVAPQSADPVAAWNAAMKPTAVELRRLLEFVAANDRSAAAAAAIQLLVRADGLHAVEGIGGRPAPLVKLTTHPDRRIRFAAMEAIVGLDPKEPFTGSSAVADALGYFASATGTRKVVVADTNVSRGRDVGGIATSEFGGRPEVATNARDAVRLVAGDPDVEAVLMYRSMMLAELGQLLAQLRADPRTARLPVFVYCEPNDFERTRSLLSTDPFAFAILQPRSLEMLKAQSGPEVIGAVKAQVFPQQRVSQARTALAAMAKLMASNNKTFNLRPYEAAILSAAWNAATNNEAVPVLAQFGSAAAQRTLADLASAQTWPIETRTAAADGFRESVKRFGILLTTSELSRQYERYNASATADKATQEVLGGLLDTIESRGMKTAAAQPGATPPGDKAPAAPPAKVPATEANPFGPNAAKGDAPAAP